MGRPVVLSNGSLFIGLNKHGFVHDFYYPYVGLENLTTTRSERHKIGVMVNGVFSWLNDGSWHISVDFETEALISTVTWSRADIGIQIQAKDFVDPYKNAFCRRIDVCNTGSVDQDVKLFFHQVFEISHAGRADTALYEPDGHYILDYKGRCCLLIYAQTSEGIPFDQFAVGNSHIEGKEGTFKDAEDGVLSGNPVEHGGVDSTIGIALSVAPSELKTVHYWVVAADSQQDADTIHDMLLAQGLESRLEEARLWWHNWIMVSENRLHLIEGRYVDTVKKSLLVIKAHIDRRGGVLASGDSSIFNYGRDYYCYCWPRDGAYAMWPLIRLGYFEEARTFFEFSRDILHKDGYLMHKYQPDKSIGSTWHPLLHGNHRELAIQEDETAIVLIMLGEFLKESGDKDFVEQLYDTLIRPSADFMARFIDASSGLPHASYDLWEEKFLTTTYTTATVFAALKVASNLAELFDFPDDSLRWRDTTESIKNSMEKLYDTETSTFIKGFILQQDGSVIKDSTIDVSSMYGMFMFGPIDHQKQVDDFMKVITETILDRSPSGGAPRYEHDSYMRMKPQYTGNPWFITSLWIAQYFSENNQVTHARSIVDWVLSKANQSGMLSEQIDPETSVSVGVSPLVWSHAELINTVLDVSEV
jgi:GH15 family glucan-1,4-alpha-glucosidase